MPLSLSQSKCSKCPTLARIHRYRQTRSRTRTECSKSWSATRPFRDCWKILGQWFGLYVAYGWENVYSSHAPKFPEWSFVVPTASRKRLHTRLSASRWRCVSKLGQTQLIFVDPAVKINGAYYRDVLLTQQLGLLPVVQEISVGFFILQQLLQHTAHATQSNFLNGRHPHSLHQTCGPPVVQILTQYTTRCGAKCSSGSTRQSHKSTWPG